MFYSHQLLARKAPLGQIWRAATLHAKINRRNLNKLNIINICEEILNPSVPMALRLSGILMGGVVIVYERKVKLLYEDVTRLLVEINEAWKVKAKRDPTVLPKGKSQAKYEAVTLPDNQPADLGDIEQHIQFSNSDTVMGMNKSAYIDMNLDNIDESYIFHNQGDVDLPHDHHQADIENITLFDRFDSHQTDAGRFNQFEKFDIEGDDIEGGDDVTLEKSLSHNHTLIPSPPLQDEPNKPDEIHEQHPDHNNPQSDEDKAQPIPHMQRRIPQMQRLSRKRARRAPSVIMDHEQTMISGNMYQSWLQDASDLISRRGRKIKPSSGIRSMKIEKLMDLPPVPLVDGLFTNGNNDIYYPLPLLKQWMKLTQHVHDSPSGANSPPHPPVPSSSSSPPEANNFHDPTAFPFEEHHSGVRSGSLGVSIEKDMPDVNNHEIPEIISSLMSNVTRANGGPVADAGVAVTPANSGGRAQSMRLESGPRFVPQVSDINFERSSEKRLYSSTRKSGSSLDPVAEELSFSHTDINFKLAQLTENELSPERLIVESGPTQTQKVPVTDQPMEQITDSIRMQLKAHFDTPGCAQTESLNQLALGLDRKKAACLFYQTCVLASRGYIKVQQKEPYGNIIISRGAKM